MTPTLTMEDWQKIGKGALIAVTGALLTYGTEVITQLAASESLGLWTPLVVAGWSIVVNYARKSLKDIQ